MRILLRDAAMRRGLLRYFTGQPCRHGHICERDTASRTCLECKRSRVRKYLAKRRQSDPELREACLRQITEWKRSNPQRAKEAAQRRRQRPEYLEQERLRMRGYRSDNADHVAAVARAWRKANREKQRAYDRRKREKDPASRLALLKKLANDPVYIMASYANRRARKKVLASVTGAELVMLLTEANGRCTGCFKRRKLTFDHIQPLARGGAHAARNLQMLCSPCNIEKGARDPVEWARSIHRPDLVKQYENLELAA